MIKINKKNAIFYVLTISLALLLSLFITTQIAIFYFKGRDLLYQEHPFINFEIRPNQKIISAGTKLTHLRDITINQYGFRGDEITMPKGKDVFRIFILGGSSVFEYVSSEKETFTKILEKNLNSAKWIPSKKIECINAGVPGYNVMNSLQTYIYKIRYLQPDLIIVYHTWNDIKYFKKANGKPIDASLVQNFREDVYDYINKSFPWNSFYAVPVLFERIWSKLSYLGMNKVLYNEDKVKAKIISAPNSFPGATLFQNSLNDLVTLIQNDHVQVVVASEASLVKADNSRDENASIGYDAIDISHDEFFVAHQTATHIIKQISQQHHIPYIPIRENTMNFTLAEIADHVHLNPAGSAIVANFLYENLLPLQFN
ncbi:MAG: hypothetical protein HQK52_01735 [Oligoflexia bacterium]|nr:hypothetical protein [Oligoflexia bacterium]